MASSFPVGVGPALQVETAASAVLRRADLAALPDQTPAMASSGIAVYPVSTRGMMSSLPGAERSGEAQADPGGRGAVREVDQRASEQYELQVSTEHLAELTGGRATYNTNDLAGALARSVEEGRHYYRLAYTPENKGTDGRFRRISVMLKGRGYRLAYRQGYFATADARPVRDESRNGSATGTKGALDATGIRLSANLRRNATTAGETTVDAWIDPATVTFLPGMDGLQHAKLLVKVAAEPATGGAPAPEKQAMLNLGLEAADLRAVLQAGISVRETISGATAATPLRLEVRDLQGGQAGTLHMP